MNIPSKELLIQINHQQHLTFRQMAERLSIPSTSLYRLFKSYNLIAFRKPYAWNSGKTCYDDKRILSGKNHPRWKDISKYYIEFKLLTKQMLKNKIKCSHCNKLAKLLHHFDKNTQNNSSKNLIPLCRSCHTILHNKERGISITYFNCLQCGKRVKIISFPSHKRKFCSLSCSGKYFYNKGIFNIKNNKFIKN